MSAVAHASSATVTGPGLFGYAPLQQPNTVLDHVVDRLREKAERWAAEDGSGGRIAEQVVVRELTGVGRVPLDVDAVAFIDSAGRVVLAGQVSRSRVVSGQPTEACTLLLNLLATTVLGPGRQDVYGRFIPVRELRRLMGEALQRDTLAARLAAETVWRQTVMRFEVYEHERQELTRCIGLTTDTSWAVRADTAGNDPVSTP